MLEFNPGERKVILTLKKGLLGSKLPIIADVSNAVPGAKAHGFVTGVKDYGVFVSFYGGVGGLAPVNELGLTPDQKPQVGLRVLWKGGGLHSGLKGNLKSLALCAAVNAYAQP